jgi:hypothetical protein
MFIGAPTKWVEWDSPGLLRLLQLNYDDLNSTVNYYIYQLRSRGVIKA